jgi:hypothetical protein
MDAMLEGELHNGRSKPVVREREMAEAEAKAEAKFGSDAPILPGGASHREATLGTHSPPGSR